MSAATITLEGSLQPGVALQPRKLESAAGRASSLTTVPAAYSAVQVPVPPGSVMVQSMPAGWEVIRPCPFPPRTIEMNPVAPAVEAGGTVHPDRLAGVAVADPSFTSTMQSAVANGSRSILKPPAASLSPMATPSTVIARLAVAWPSIRSLVPLSSARDMLTVACAAGGARGAPIRTSNPAMASRITFRSNMADPFLKLVADSLLNFMCATFSWM